MTATKQAILIAAAIVFGVALAAPAEAHICLDSPVAFFIEDFDHSGLPAAPHADADPEVDPDCS